VTTPPRLGACLLCLLSARLLLADIAYDATEGRIWVKGFPEEAPATLDMVLDADSKGKWGKVTYDKASDTYTIAASLWIGSDGDLGTFVQIGRKDHPRETLVLKGDLWIRPPRESIKRSDGRASIVNRLTLGHPNDASILPSLKIACSKPREFGICLGLRTADGKAWTRGGDLHAYNSILTAALQDRDHILRGSGEHKGYHTGWYGSDIRLVNSTLSWIDGAMTYGADAGNAVFDGTTFEHGGRALANSRQYARKCTFRDLETAVAEGGSLDATLVNCTFENNALNWSLGSAMSQGVTLIDCKVGPPKPPPSKAGGPHRAVSLRKNQVTADEAVKRRIPLYPCYNELRSLVVKVTDKDGRPVPRAVVHVACDDATALRTPLAITDDHGLTSHDVEKDAVLLTVLRLQATDKPDEPKEFRFRYTVTVSAAGHKPKTIPIADPAKLSRPMPVTIERER